MLPIRVVLVLQIPLLCLRKSLLEGAVVEKNLYLSEGFFRFVFKLSFIVIESPFRINHGFIHSMNVLGRGEFAQCLGIAFFSCKLPYFFYMGKDLPFLSFQLF